MNKTTFSLGLASFIWANSLLSAPHIDQIKDVDRYILDDQALFLSKEGDNRRVFYFPRSALKVVKHPENPAASSSTIQVNVQLKKPDIQSIRNKVPTWAEASFTQLELTMQNDCQISERIDHLRQARATFTNYNSKILGVSDTLLCSVTIWVDRGFQDEVISSLNKLHESGQVLSNLFQVRLESGYSQEILSWIQVHRELSQLMSNPLEKVTADQALFYLGLALAGDVTFRSWWQQSSEIDRSDFLKTALEQIFVEQGHEYTLKPEAHEELFLAPNTDTLDLKF